MNYGTIDPGVRLLNTANTSRVCPLLAFVSKIDASSQPSRPSLFSSPLKASPSSLPPTQKPEVAKATLRYSQFMVLSFDLESVEGIVAR